MESHITPDDVTAPIVPEKVYHQPPGGNFSLANSSPNFSQKFDQKLTTNPGGHFSLDSHENNIANQGLSHCVESARNPGFPDI